MRFCFLLRVIFLEIWWRSFFLFWFYVFNKIVEWGNWFCWWYSLGRILLYCYLFCLFSIFWLWLRPKIKCSKIHIWFRNFMCGFVANSWRRPKLWRLNNIWKIRNFIYILFRINFLFLNGGKFGIFFKNWVKEIHSWVGLKWMSLCFRNIQILNINILFWRMSGVIVIDLIVIERCLMLG